MTNAKEKLLLLCDTAKNSEYDLTMKVLIHTNDSATLNDDQCRALVADIRSASSMIDISGKKTREALAFEYAREIGAWINTCHE